MLQLPFSISLFNEYQQYFTQNAPVYILFVKEFASRDPTTQEKKTATRQLAPPVIKKVTVSQFSDFVLHENRYN
jgi:hypothetical protein